MLKRVAVFVVLAMCISMASMTNAHAEARGPKIFGLQVGMPWEEAVQIVREYAAKKGLEVLGKNRIVIGLLDRGDQNGIFTYKDEHIIISNNDTPFLTEMEVFTKAFNIRFLDDEKLQAICNKYKIPYDKLTPFSTGLYSGSKYINSKDGYIVLITLVNITVKSIEKTSDMVLE